MREKRLAQKQSVVDEIKDHAKNAKSMVLVDYRGLTVDEVTDLRRKFREEDVVYKVYKNTMMNFAFKDLGYDEFLDLLNGPNAIAFSMEDPIAAARVSNDFSKDHEALEIKAGYLGDEFLDQEKVLSIAKIPSREVLLAKLLGSFKAPVSNFAYLIKAIKDQKEEGAEATEAPAEEAVEESTEE